MIITKQVLLKRTEEIKEEVINYIISQERRPHRKAYYAQTKKEYKATDVLNKLITEGTSLKSAWFTHCDLLGYESFERGYAHFDLGVNATIEHFLSCIDDESTQDEIYSSIPSINDEMCALFYSANYDSEKLIRERDDKYRHLYEELCKLDSLFQEKLESYPEILRYYKETYLKERELTARLNCRDYYFAGCRTVLHVIMDEILTPW